MEKEYLRFIRQVGIYVVAILGCIILLAGCEKDNGKTIFGNEPTIRWNVLEKSSGIEIEYHQDASNGDLISKISITPPGGIVELKELDGTHLVFKPFSLEASSWVEEFGEFTSQYSGEYYEVSVLDQNRIRCVFHDIPDDWVGHTWILQLLDAPQQGYLIFEVK